MIGSPKQARKEGIEMGDDRNCDTRKVEVAGVMGPIWIIGWLFTIGFVHLSFGKAFLGLVLWPYYLGKALGG
jgi:hypothetical protein